MFLIIKTFKISMNVNMIRIFVNINVPTLLVLINVNVPMVICLIMMVKVVMILTNAKKTQIYVEEEIVNLFKILMNKCFLFFLKHKKVLIYLVFIGVRVVMGLL